MNRFPLFLSVRDVKTVVIGGGAAAMRKARLLAEAGARPQVIWSSIPPETRAALAGRADIVEADPAPADLAGARLVFIAVDNEDAAARWAQAARRAGALVNVVDRPALCDFTTPSIIDRGRLTVAISTDGAAPVFAKALREKIEALTPARAGALLDFAARYREAAQAALAPEARRAFWEAVFDGPIAEAVLAGDAPRAHEAMLAALNTGGGRPAGVVHIVGAGPGDPELLTLKALRILQSADVILHDRLVTDEILSLARRDADRFYVGKAKSDHAVPQDEIERRMVALAREGKIVVRLKGGDPFVFGRGGEELDALRAAGVAVHVTPGVTAAAGCAAAAGMALTHRDLAQAVTFATGHAKGDADPDLDWAALAALKNTLVIYMGVGKAEGIARRLIEAGRDRATPVAVIENGTRPDQRILKGALEGLGGLVAANGVDGPAILVIGEVAARADGAGLVAQAQGWSAAA